MQNVSSRALAACLAGGIAAALGSEWGVAGQIAFAIAALASAVAALRPRSLVVAALATALASIALAGEVTLAWLAITFDLTNHGPTWADFPEILPLMIAVGWATSHVVVVARTRRAAPKPTPTPTPPVVAPPPTGRPLAIAGLVALVAVMLLSFATHHTETRCEMQYDDDVDHFCMFECGPRDRAPPVDVCRDAPVEPIHESGAGVLGLVVAIATAALAVGHPRDRRCAVAAIVGAGLLSLSFAPTLSHGGLHIFDLAVAVADVLAIAHAVALRRPMPPRARAIS